MNAVSNICRLSGFAARQLAIQTTLFFGGFLLTACGVVALVSALCGLPPLDFAFDVAAPAAQSLFWLGVLAAVFATVAASGQWCLFWAKALTFPQEPSAWALRFRLRLSTLLVKGAARILSGLSTVGSILLVASHLRRVQYTPAALSGATPRLE